MSQGVLGPWRLHPSSRQAVRIVREEDGRVGVTGTIWPRVGTSDFLSGSLLLSSCVI